MKKNTKTKMLGRMSILMAFIVIFLFTGAARIFYLQVFRGDELSKKAESQQMMDKEVKAMRGTIYDCDKNVLAQSATVWDVFIDPYEIICRPADGEEPDEKRIKELEEATEKKRQAVVDGLAKFFEYDEEEKAELLKLTYNEKSRYELVKKQIENDLKMKIAEYASENNLNCIGFDRNSKRYYPYGSLASNVLGFTGGDDQGIYGLELYYEDELTGMNGRVVTAKDAWQNEISDEYETSVEAVDGNSLVLTINQTIQYHLEKGLREALEEYQPLGAYGVVMNCKTGAVLAMSSLPDYDCNNPTEITYSKYKKELKTLKKKTTDKKKIADAELDFRQKQWQNYTIEGAYEPGSVYKVFTAASALEENIVTPNTSYTCTGAIQVESHKMNCHYHPGHGTQNLAQGLANSCNPFFITVGQKLGAKNYFKYFDAFGFSQKTGIDLPWEIDPVVTDRTKMGIVELSSASFGQTNNLTPIEVCTGLCAVANGGNLMKPYVVDSIIDADGKTVKKTEPTVVRQVISSETAKTVRSMMKEVVDTGTGKNGYVAGYRVGGKTGTSTKLEETRKAGKNCYVVSFAAIAPSDDPEIALLIAVNEPNVDLGGGAICAPIAAEVIEETMSVLGIEPKYSEDEISNLAGYTPNVVGKTLDKAKEELKLSNLNYVVIGKGDKIVRQCPTSADTIQKNGTVYIYMGNGKKKTTKVPNFSGLTVTEAKNIAKTHNLNIEITGNNMKSGTVVAFRQSEEKDAVVEQGTVITVSFKNTESALD